MADNLDFVQQDRNYIAFRQNRLAKKPGIA
jgi:hypothetical protein